MKKYHTLVKGILAVILAAFFSVALSACDNNQYLVKDPPPSDWRSVTMTPAAKGHQVFIRFFKEEKIFSPLDEVRDALRRATGMEPVWISGFGYTVHISEMTEKISVPQDMVIGVTFKGVASGRYLEDLDYPGVSATKVEKRSQITMGRLFSAFP